MCIAGVACQGQAVPSGSRRVTQDSLIFYLNTDMLFRYCVALVEADLDAMVAMVRAVASSLAAAAATDAMARPLIWHAYSFAFSTSRFTCRTRCAAHRQSENARLERVHAAIVAWRHVSACP